MNLSSKKFNLSWLMEEQASYRFFRKARSVLAQNLSTDSGSGISKLLFCKMRISLGRPHVRVTQQLLQRVDLDTPIDRKARE